jgi:hypothetical protein
MLAPKADPVGRYPLVDIRWSQSAVGPYMGINWCGENRLGLGGGYFGEPNTEFEEYEGKMYLRSHTPLGVKVRKAGLGTVLYSGLALIAYETAPFAGIWSPSDREDTPSRQRHRSPEATAWWTEQIRRGYAMETTISDNGNAIDYLPVDHVIESGLLVFAPVKESRSQLSYRQLPFGLVNDAAWQRPVLQSEAKLNDDKFFRRSTYETVDDDPWAIEHRSGSDAGIYTEEGGFAHSQMTLELLPRAWHPDRPMLAAIIMDTLAQQDESRAVEYVTRPDIAKMLGRNKKMQQLLSRRASPGLSGLSGYAHREMMHAVASAAVAADIEVSNFDNPLHFTALSRQTKKFVDALAADES